MKKVISFVFMALTVLLLASPLGGVAEAARVAVVPIQIDDQKVEEYELMDDEKVAAVIPDEGLQSFDQATLAAICEKTDAEIVVAMKLNKVEENSQSFKMEPMLECIMKGEFAGYNRLTGKYYYKKMYYKEEIEEILTIKNDWQQNVFASNLKRYINRVMEDNTKPKKKK